MKDNKKTIGQRIKTRREELGLTQEDLGKKLCLNKSTIQRYESGKVERIKIPVLHAIAKALNVNPEWLALKTDVMGEFVENFNFATEQEINSNSDENSAFFRLKKGLEPYNINEDDAEFILSVFKAHKKKNEEN